MTSSATDPATTKTFRLMYRSRSQIPAERSRAELGALFTQARSNNKKRGITGALLLTGTCFVQVLEGDEADVRGVYTRISGDPRHDSVTLIESGTVDERVFARWAMARVSQDDEPDIPLIAHQSGITSAAGHRTTLEEDRLLDVMRAAANGPSLTV
jgi:hypothetical protein